MYASGSAPGRNFCSIGLSSRQNSLFAVSAMRGSSSANPATLGSASPSAGRTARRATRPVARLSRTTFPAAPGCAPATGPHITVGPCLPRGRSARKSRTCVRAREGANAGSARPRAGPDAQGGAAFSREDDVRLYAMIQQAGQLAAHAVEIIFAAAGSSAAKRGTRLQRYYRDMAMYRGHIAAQYLTTAGELARVHFGLPDSLF
ncbi:MAG: hypothetical protein ACLQB1_28880 [Streptosporangiaceae bacterium]